MNNSPRLKLVFLLTKKDCDDFDRNAVSQRLNIKHSKESAPELSKGRVYCNADISETKSKLSGITILPSTSPPYQLLKHAYWSTEMLRTECWELKELLQQLEQELWGKEFDVMQICKDYNLSADLIVRVFADSNNMPELTIPNSSVSFWASMGVSIGFDFYLD